MKTNKILIYFLIFLIPFAVGTSSSINFLSKGQGDILYCHIDGSNCALGGGGNGTYNLNVSGDTGTGVITDGEILSILGINGLATSMVGDIVTITKTNQTSLDTNETPRFNNLLGNCTGTDKVFGVNFDGSKYCDTDIDTQLTGAEVGDHVGNWTDDKPNYPTNTDLTNNITNANNSITTYIDDNFLLTASHTLGLHEGLGLWSVNNFTQLDIDFWNSWVDTNAGTICPNGEYLDGDTTCYNFNDSVADAVKTTTYLASSIATETGTLDQGNLASTQTIFDGDSYNVSEVTGSPGFLIYINFTGVVDFNEGIIREQYVGGAGHTVHIGVWNYNTGVWDEEWAEITDQEKFFIIAGTVFGSTNYILGGLVQMRLDHDNSGIPSHDFYIDYVALTDGFTSTVTTDHDALSGRTSPDNHPQYVLNTGDTMTGGLNMSDGNVTMNNNFNCHNVNCSSYTYHNGTHLIIQT